MCGLSVAVLQMDISLIFSWQKLSYNILTAITVAGNIYI